MTRVTLNSAAQSLLPSLDEQLELCDESGRTLGYFLTASQYEEFLCEWAKLKYPEDELERIYNEPGEYSTAEILAHLEKL